MAGSGWGIRMGVAIPVSRMGLAIPASRMGVAIPASRMGVAIPVSPDVPDGCGHSGFPGCPGWVWPFRFPGCPGWVWPFRFPRMGVAIPVSRTGLAIPVSRMGVAIPPADGCGHSAWPGRVWPFRLWPFRLARMGVARMGVAMPPPGHAASRCAHPGGPTEQLARLRALERPATGVVRTPSRMAMPETGDGACAVRYRDRVATRRPVITTRPRPDLDGDPVDGFPSELILTGSLLGSLPDGGELPEPDHIEVARKVVKLLRGIAAGLGAKARRLDVAVILGEVVNEHANSCPFLAVHMVGASKLGAPIVEGLGTILHETVRGACFCDGHVMPMSELRCRPVARWLRGRMVVYKRRDAHFDNERFEGVDADDIEWRSWELSPPPLASAALVGEGVRAQARHRDRQSRLDPGVRDALERCEHGLDEWQVVLRRIERVVEAIRGPIGFEPLREIVERRFRIPVVLVESSRLVRMGCIRLGWLNRRQAGRVAILVSSDLDEGQRAVVLAHELGHYFLHFPLLHTAQFVRNHSSRRPELEVLWAAMLTELLPGGVATLEAQANLFASTLIAPLHVRAWREYMLANTVTDETVLGSIEECMMRQLQPYFRTIGTGALRWDRPTEKARLLEFFERERRPARDLNDGDGTSLLRAMVAALMERDAQGTASIAPDAVVATIGPPIARIKRLILDLATRHRDVAAAERESADRNFLGEQVTLRTLALARTWSPALVPGADWDGTPAAELGALTFGAEREVIPPRGWNEMHLLFPRVELEPAPWNLEGAREGEWFERHPERAPGRDDQCGTIDEFLEHGPAGHGVVLNRLDAWERTPEPDRLVPDPLFVEMLRASIFATATTEDAEALLDLNDDDDQEDLR